MASLLVTGIGELTTNDPALGRGVGGRLEDAALVVDDGRVAWVGPAGGAPSADERSDVAGAAVVPGFVESHTHLVFAGERSAEFEARVGGRPYDGRGILDTVAATRSAPRWELADAAEARADRLRAGGVTTLEVKSGYELTVEGEASLVGLAAAIAHDVTFLGAHAVPPEYEGRREEYVELVAGPMLRACSPLANWVDVFCDVGAFDVDEARVVLEAGAAAGLGLRLHANQLAATGAVALGVGLGAASVDHCSRLSDADVDLLASSPTVATLTPWAELATRSPRAPARRLVDAGARIALSTDCNPGTSYLTSMPLVIALAVAEYGLSVEEAVWAATRGGATALRRDDVGHLGLGALADFVVLDGPRAAHLAYRPGTAVVAAVYREGRRLA